MGNNSIKFLFAIVIVWLLNGCYSKKEGCLDPYASNYDVSADDACFNCCEYPFLRIKTQNHYGDSTYYRGDTLTNQLGQQFLIIGFKYYMSHFRLFQEGKALTVRRVLENRITNEIIPDDICIGGDNELYTNVGTIKTYGKFDSLQFSFGISPEFVDETLYQLPEKHVLLKNVRLNDSDGNLASAVLKYRLITPVDTTITIAISSDFLLNLTLRDSINITQPGQIIEARVHADYQKILDDVDLTAPNEQIRSLLRERLTSFLLVK